jgi:hypothetical protein
VLPVLRAAFSVRACGVLQCRQFINAVEAPVAWLDNHGHDNDKETLGWEDLKAFDEVRNDTGCREV